MTSRALAAAAVVAAAAAALIAGGVLPGLPAAWDVQGGGVATTCWTVSVSVPCDTGQFPASVCPYSGDGIAQVLVRAPTDPTTLPAALLGMAGQATITSMVETPGSCPSNGKVLQLVGPADDGPTCVAGDVTGGGAGRRIDRCCAPGCACASAWCRQVPAVEVAGHEGVWARRLCAYVRTQPSPPAAATTWCDANVPLGGG